MVLLTVVHIDFTILIDAATASACLRLVAPGPIDRPLAILAAILLVALVVSIDVLLLHAKVVLLLDEGRLVSVQVTDFLLLTVTFLVCINGCRAIIGLIVHEIGWISQLS